MPQDNNRIEYQQEKLSFVQIAHDDILIKHNINRALEQHLWPRKTLKEVFIEVIKRVLLRSKDQKKSARSHGNDLLIP